MSGLKQASPSRLTNLDERAQAKLARIAQCDCIHGGARALVLAKRLTGSHIDFDSVVSAAYTSSTGTASEYLPYECPECGRVCLGESAAYACCSENKNDELDDVCDQCMSSISRGDR